MYVFINNTFNLFWFNHFSLCINLQSYVYILKRCINNQLIDFYQLSFLTWYSFYAVFVTVTIWSIFFINWPDPRKTYHIMLLGDAFLKSTKYTKLMNILSKEVLENSILQNKCSHLRYGTHGKFHIKVFTFTTFVSIFSLRYFYKTFIKPYVIILALILKVIAEYTAKYW